MTRVLILSAGVGGGHSSAAKALECAFKEMCPTEEVRHVDMLDYTTTLFRVFYAKTYSYTARHLPLVAGSLYKKLNEPWRPAPLRRAFDRFNTKRFVTMLQNYKADIAICTHFLPAEIMSWLSESQLLNVSYSVVVTDFDVHAIWLSKWCERYFVPTGETRVQIESRGVDTDRITVTGIPIDPIFCIRKDKCEIRRELGLDEGRDTILLSGRRFSFAVLEKIMASLASLARGVQIIVTCGPQEEIRRMVQEVADHLSSRAPVTFKIVGVARDIHELMAASDLIVGRPGGLTSAEALASGLVFVIVNPIPGQEERNADYLLEEGVGIRCNDLAALAYKIECLLGDTRRLGSMKKNSERIARPRAAFDVVNTLLPFRDTR